MTAPSPDPAGLLDRLEKARQAAAQWLAGDGRDGYGPRTVRSTHRYAIDELFALPEVEELLRLARQGQALEAGVLALAESLEADAQRQVDRYAADSDVLPAVVGRAWINAARQFRALALAADTTGEA